MSLPSKSLDLLVEAGTRGLCPLLFVEGPPARRRWKRRQPIASRSPENSARGNLLLQWRWRARGIQMSSKVSVNRVPPCKGLGRGDLEQLPESLRSACWDRGSCCGSMPCFSKLGVSCEESLSSSSSGFGSMEPHFCQPVSSFWLNLM